MENNSPKIQFNSVLADPATADADVLARLVERYPYTQSLYVARAQLAMALAPDAFEAALPLLYVGTPRRLYSLLVDTAAAEDDDLLTDDDIDSLDDMPDKPIGERPADAIGDVNELPLATPPAVNPVFHIDDPEAEAADLILEAVEEDDAEDIEITEADPDVHSVTEDANRSEVETAEEADEELTEQAETTEPQYFSVETVVPDTHDEEQLAVSETTAVEEEQTPEASTPITVMPVEEDDLGMLPEHPIAMDYLAYEELVEPTDEESSGSDAEKDEPAADVSAEAATAAGSEHVEPVADTVSKDQQIVPAHAARPHEKVSLYDDEHMPYTFLWWLTKARMEHAGAYQPYVAPQAMQVDREGKPELRTPEEQTVLDQQIRENIFHLQPPEEKLGTTSEIEPMEFKIPKKTDPIIERFIREEPQIKPPNPDKLTLKNMAKHSAEDTQEIVTETLAKIYADQGHYNKAIDAYQKLSLKYPEKSSYFAGRISELEKKVN